MVFRVIIFLIINFAALGIGGIFTEKGLSSDWYANLDKAPWTPPGYTFGIAWSTIMVCFGFYMAYLWPKAPDKKLLVFLFSIQWLLNVMWNPVFFYYHNILLGLIVIALLTILVGFLLVYFYPVLKVKSVLLAPYFLWLLIAASLNAYIYFNN